MDRGLKVEMKSTQIKNDLIKFQSLFLWTEDLKKENHFEISTINRFQSLFLWTEDLKQILTTPTLKTIRVSILILMDRGLKVLSF